MKSTHLYTLMLLHLQSCCLTCVDLNYPGTVCKQTPPLNSISLINRKLSVIAMVGSYYLNTNSAGLLPNLTYSPLGSMDHCLIVSLLIWNPLLVQPPSKQGHPWIVQIYTSNSTLSDIIPSDMVSSLLEPLWFSAKAHFNTEGLL